MRSFPLLPSSRSRLTDELRAACREEMRAEIKRTKALLNPDITMFGVDLLLPSTDEGARKTNKGVGNDLLTQLVRIPPDLQHAPRAQRVAGPRIRPAAA